MCMFFRLRQRPAPHSASPCPVGSSRRGPGHPSAPPPSASTRGSARTTPTTAKDPPRPANKSTTLTTPRTWQTWPQCKWLTLDYFSRWLPRACFSRFPPVLVSPTWANQCRRVNLQGKTAHALLRLPPEMPVVMVCLDNRHRRIRHSRHARTCSRTNQHTRDICPETCRSWTSPQQHISLVQWHDPPTTLSRTAKTFWSVPINLGASGAKSTTFSPPTRYVPLTL